VIDQDILDGMNGRLKPWNEKVCEGLATEEMKRVPARIDQAMRSAFSSLDPRLKYLDCRPATPLEAYQEITRPRQNRNLYEQTKSSTYLYRFNFTFDGEPMKPRYMFLPHCDRFGIVTLRDSRYVYSPTVSDQLFSVEEGKVFIPFTRSPVTIYREDFCYIQDGCLIPVDVHCSRLHYTPKHEVPKSRHPQIMNYLFSLWGVTEAFRFMGMEVAVMREGEYCEEDYPTDTWAVCKPSGKKPKGRINMSENYDVVLCVKREHLNRVTESFIGSFFYITDNTSDVDYLAPENMDSPIVWRRALARFIWRSYDPLQAVEDIGAHLESLEEYMDEIFKNRLKTVNLEVGSIWELFRHVLMNYHEMTLKNNPASVRGKRLTVLEQVTQPMIIMINNLMFAIRKQQKKKFRRDYIEDIMNRNFRQNVISELADGHPEVSLLETATPSAVMKTTGLIYRPSKNTGSASAADMQNPMFHLNAEMLPLFSLRMVTKSSPTASNRVRPGVELGPNNEVIFGEDTERFREEFARLTK
jgi:hypothetical protein